ncbi:MAG: 4Fe-4S ferredoxin [Elusimicrobia bacterium HGW-Elusimicrobia-2]|nr:MAG: 4Fe-4S ferredoxin [Elusimicrobia bacterium HGW-Elusimicrobia-2]
MKYPKLRELKEAVISFFSPAATVKYPFGPAKIHPRFKGKPQPQDTCIGCGGCVQWCPAGAIKEINDTETGKRKIIWHFDECIMCGECERICTTEDGVKMVPEFELAGFDRKLMRAEKECELLLCESCGAIISTREQVNWILEKLGEKQPANLALFSEKLKSLGLAEDTLKTISLAKRDDMFALLCPKCRHRVNIYDSL